MSVVEGIAIWEATSSVGKPVCIVASNDLGLSVSLYRDRDGGIIGGLVSYDSDLVEMFGEVPYDVFAQELKYVEEQTGETVTADRSDFDFILGRTTSSL